MSETRFNLVFEGKVEPGCDRGVVQSTLELLFRFDDDVKAQLFSGRTIVLGERMDEATANSFKQALARAGAATRLEALNGAGTVETRKERRKAKRRVGGDRRSRVRTEAILPDRRKNPDRRR